MVVAGNDKGTKGEVVKIETGKNRAIVQGVNVISKHTKPNAQYPEGGIIKKEAAVHISNLMIIDPKTGEPSRVGRKEVDGKLIRYAKKSGEILS